MPVKLWPDLTSSQSSGEGAQLHVATGGSPLASSRFSVGARGAEGREAKAERGDYGPSGPGSQAR